MLWSTLFSFTLAFSWSCVRFLKFLRVFQERVRSKCPLDKHHACTHIYVPVTPLLTPAPFSASPLPWPPSRLHARPWECNDDMALPVDCLQLVCWEDKQMDKEVHSRQHRVSTDIKGQSKGWRSSERESVPRNSGKRQQDGGRLPEAEHSNWAGMMKRISKKEMEKEGHFWLKEQFE